jgi:autotransporter-associated beta strand protein
LPLVATDVTDGNIVVNGGTMSFETTTNVPAGTGAITFNTGTTWSFFGFTGTLARPVVVNGAVTVGPNNNAVSIAVSPITLNGDLTATALNANGTGTVALNGPIGETGGPHSITKVNNGTGNSVLALGGNNTFSGGVNVNAGIVEISTVNNLGTGPLTFNGGTLRFATGSGGADVSVRTVTLAGAATIDTNGNSVTFGNPIGNNGAGGLTKIGAGILNLAAANTYTGATTVTAGTLRVNNTTGSGTGAGAVAVTGTGAVGSGGTLGGGNTAGTAGFITGPITISSTVPATQGGTVSPGNSIGTLNVASMNWNPFGQYVFEHSALSNATGGAANDFTNGSGTLDLSALSPGATFTMNLTPVNFSPAPTQMDYTVATFAGGITGPGGPFANGSDASSLFTLAGGFTSAPAMYATVVGNIGGPQSLVISFTPVPEPAFMLLACGAAAGGFGWWRRAGMRANAAD